MKLKFSRQFSKHSNIKFHENLSSGSRVAPCGQTGPSQQSLFAILRTRLKILFTLPEFEMVQSAFKPTSRLNQISFIPTDEVRTHAVFHKRTPIFDTNFIERYQFGLTMWETKIYCLESRSRGISYMKYVNGRRTGLVTFCVETAFYNGLLKERYKGG